MGKFIPLIIFALSIGCAETAAWVVQPAEDAYRRLSHHGLHFKEAEAKCRSDIDAGNLEYGLQAVDWTAYRWFGPGSCVAVFEESGWDPGD